MNYLDECKKYIGQIVAEEAKAVQEFIDRDIQPKTWKELDRLAFEKSLEEVKKLEAMAGLGEF